ncbi:MAG TPA: metal ABC transporter permease [Spirochaetota bacterium]|nr:metal ABC transporter permease [Spirochaetota bacterium]HPJ34283.1 metal ABC transporter permease [Spirochaetota bacterium]
MTGFLNALLNPEIPFIRFALIAGLLSSIPFGVIGSFVVVKRMTYIAGALSHAALGGIGIALYVGTKYDLQFLTPMTGAFLFSMIAGLIISMAVLSGRERVDTIIGVIWAAGMSVGLLFISITPGYVDPMSYLFGNILLLTEYDLGLIAVLNGIIIIFSMTFYNQLLATAFDEEFTRIRGINTAFYQIMLILLMSMTVILMISIVGIVMIIAFLTIPPAVSGFFTRRLRSMMLLSIILCALIMSTGLFLSYLLKLPSSSVTILLAALIYAVCFFIRKDD